MEIDEVAMRDVKVEKGRGLTAIIFFIRTWVKTILTTLGKVVGQQLESKTVSSAQSIPRSKDHKKRI